MDHQRRKFGIARLYCGTSGTPGFYNSQEIGMAKAMVNLGYDCYIFFPDNSVREPYEKCVSESISIVYCPAKKVGVHSRYDWRIILRKGIEVLLIETDNQLFAPDLIRFCDRNAIKVCNYVGVVKSDSDNVIKKSFMSLAYKRVLKSIKTHKTFAKTDSIIVRLRGIGVDDVELMPVGLDTTIIPNIELSRAEIKQQCGLPTDRKVLLFVGRIDTYKHPEKILVLLQRLPEYHCVIIGDGALSDSIEKRISENGVQGQITWIKKLPNVDIHKYYYVADYFLNFNAQEIFGMSILEAMYQGCTVIAQRAPGPCMIIENEKSGFLVDKLDDFYYIISHNEILNRDDIRNRVVEKFSWSCSADKLHNWASSKNR